MDAFAGATVGAVNKPGMTSVGLLTAEPGGPKDLSLGEPDEDVQFESGTTAISPPQPNCDRGGRELRARHRAVRAVITPIASSMKLADRVSHLPAVKSGASSASTGVRAG